MEWPRQSARQVFGSLERMPVTASGEDILSLPRSGMLFSSLFTQHISLLIQPRPLVSKYTEYGFCLLGRSSIVPCLLHANAFSVHY